MSTPFDPLLLTAQLHPASHSTHGVNLTKIRASDENWYVNLAEVNTLIIPVGVGLRTATVHLCDILDSVLALFPNSQY
ncbi:hypothetical protein SNK05_006499 [Fusarium graminearum]